MILVGCAHEIDQGLIAALLYIVHDVADRRRELRGGSVLLAQRSG
jgi:hypothetical protein